MVSTIGLLHDFVRILECIANYELPGKILYLNLRLQMPRGTAKHNLVVARGLAVCRT